ncbi:MAG: class I SAM-dependent methyltransferase [Planctomycetes bacterium]|nr:class I SAM-dependent methyltransferase [Planctomycetota bacterium]
MFERLIRMIKGAPGVPGENPATRALRWLEANPSPETAAVLALYGVGNAAGSLPRGADDARLKTLEASQSPDGGFPGADVAARRLAAAEYLVGHRRRVIALMDALIDQFPDKVADNDGRLIAVAEHVTPGARVLEAGCGKGRFLAALLQKFPDIQCTGADISAALLKRLPSGITAVEGGIERLPLPDGAFDVAFSVEAIEHATNWTAAVSQLARVTKPGGRVIIIDKQLAAWGRFETPIWERWPEREEMTAMLAKFCDDVRADDVGYDGQPADGLMLAWSGRKK